MAAGDLTTADKVRDYLGLGTVEADAKLAALVTSSSAWVCQQLGGVPVLSATHTAELYDGDGTQALALRYGPVISVSSLLVNGEAVPARATVDGTGYTIDRGTLRLWGYWLTRGTQNVSVTYVAGYATVPADLEQAVIEHVALRYRDADRQGLTSASGGGDAVAFNPSAALAYINGVLDTYRTLVIA